MSPGLLVLFGVAAAVGAALRYSVDRLVQRVTGETVLPWGTLSVNAVGSLLLGLVTGLATDGHLSLTVTAVIGSGLCAGLTTFSTWSYETLRLVQEGAMRAAGVNVALSLVVGLAMAGGGLALGLRL